MPSRTLTRSHFTASEVFPASAKTPAIVGPRGLKNPVTVWLLCKPASGHRPGARPDYRFQQQHECGEVRGEGGSDAVKWERVQQIEKLKREGLTIRAAH